MYKVRFSPVALVTLLLVGCSTIDQPVETPTGTYEEHLAKGNDFLKEGEYESAIAELRMAESTAPGRNLRALSGLHRAYLKTDQAEEAKKACKSFIDATGNPQLKAEAFNMLGIWYLHEADTGNGRSGRLRRGAKAFNRALNLSSGEVHQARLNLAEVYYRQGRREKMRSVLEGYPQSVPDPGGVLTLRPISDDVYDQLTELLLADDPESPVHCLGSVKAPAKKVAPLPLYTTIASKKKIQGRVIVRTVIDKNGNVTDVEVLKGLPYGLQEEAVRAIHSWTFHPATFRGEPVAVYYNLTVNFRLG